MKRTIYSLILLCVAVLSTHAQQTPTTEKQNLVTKFRQLTGVDHVNLGINISFEDIRSNLIGEVDNEKDLTDAQKEVLRKSAIEAYDRLDEQLKSYLNDKPKISKLSEEAVFQVYDEAFTETELRELVAFFSTSTGQKALPFLRTLSFRVQESFQTMLVPKIQAFIAPKIAAETAKLKAMIQDTKTKQP